jgi:hypothetical protein
MNDGAMIRLLLGAAIALNSQCATPARAYDDGAVPLRPANARPVNAQPVNAIMHNNNPPPARGDDSAPGGSLRVTGDPAKMKLEVRQTSLTSVLAALSAAYPVSYSSAVPLDELRDGAYAGSLQELITRLLDGYDYVIRENNAALDVIILGKSGTLAVRAPTAAPIHRIPVTTRISRMR